MKESREEMDALCLYPFNVSRECLFKSDGNVFSCRQFMEEYVMCQKNPGEYKQFLEASTPSQLQAKRFDFFHNRGHYDFHN
jgi:hypothetical protein